MTDAQLLDTDTDASIADAVRERLDVSLDEHAEFRAALERARAQYGGAPACLAE